MGIMPSCLLSHSAVSVFPGKLGDNLFFELSQRESFWELGNWSSCGSLAICWSDPWNGGGPDWGFRGHLWGRLSGKKQASSRISKADQPHIALLSRSAIISMSGG